MNSAILSNIILKFTGVSDSFICLSASLFPNFIFFFRKCDFRCFTTKQTLTLTQWSDRVRLTRARLPARRSTGRA